MYDGSPSWSAILILELPSSIELNSRLLSLSRDDPGLINSIPNF